MLELYQSLIFWILMELKQAPIRLTTLFLFYQVPGRVIMLCVIGW